ncbi:MAG: virulence factor [Rhodospirillales bacterium]|nr:virulence factor [Rhodospirillales bacterium]
MAQLTILYWRDIPSQVIAKEGRKSEKILLSDRFQQAIDAAAMKDDASETDDYLAEWRRGEPTPCGDDLVSEATAAADRIESDYDAEKLRALIAIGGKESA